MIINNHRLSNELRRLHKRKRRFNWYLSRITDQEFYEMTLTSFAWILNA